MAFRRGDQIYARAADGTGPLESLVTRDEMRTGGYFAPYTWSPDGDILVFMDTAPAGDVDIGMVAMNGDSTRTWLLDTPFNEGAPAVSPDGRWLAYHSDESGRLEVYVQRFPDLGVRRPISPTGGRAPIWSRAGTELFYRNGDQMLRVPITAGDRLSPGAPELLFENSYRQGDVGGLGLSYDISADGERFLMLKDTRAFDGTGAQPQMNVVLNWHTELLERVPVP